MTDILVRYTRNADDNVSTGALKFHDDDRGDLVIGELGYVTEKELHQFAAYGIVLEPFTVEDAQEHNLVVPAKPGEGDDSEVLSADLGQDRLVEIAADEGVDLTGKRSNQAKADAIQAARDDQNSGAASLPATATSSLGENLGSSGSGTADAAPGTTGTSTPAGSAGSTGTAS